MIFEGPKIGGGGNSGFQALNLAARCGAARVILTGFDYRDAGNHWHGRHTGQLRHATPQTVANWRRCMIGAADQLKRQGVEVINASRQTALECFPRATVKELL